MRHPLTHEQRAARRADRENKRNLKEVPLFVVVGLIDEITPEVAHWQQQRQEALAVEHRQRMAVCGTPADALAMLEVWCRIREARAELLADQFHSLWTRHLALVARHAGSEYYLDLWHPRWRQG